MTTIRKPLPELASTWVSNGSEKSLTRSPHATKSMPDIRALQSLPNRAEAALQQNPFHEDSKVCDYDEDERTETPDLLTTIKSPGGVQPENAQSKSSRARLKVVTAIEDTSIFLGGLIKHPVEYNEHYSILRHSFGIVYYKGPSTSLALSIFSDEPIPTDRRLWLQLKGWTGNSGMAAKGLLRLNNSWINVTPTQQVSSEDLPPLDERAWQRDIKKFTKKAKKAQKTHILRETVVLRIPFEAADGYFRVTLTSGESRRILCPSPVFRVASTSLSASSLKGASLSSLPIELGVKVAQTVANTMATEATGPLVQTLKNRVVSAAPITQYGGYARTAWNVSGVQDRLNNMNKRYEVGQEERTAQQRLYEALPPAGTRSNIVGSDSGPDYPFPVHSKGSVTKGTGDSAKLLGMPTANLDDLPADLLAPLIEGVYFGWALEVPQDKSQVEIHEEWRQAVITVTYFSSGNATVARRKSVRVYLIHDFPVGYSSIGSKLELMIMGYLRPAIASAERETILLETVNDISITQVSLTRPAWGPEETLYRIQAMESSKSMTDRLGTWRAAGQRQVDRVPVHKLGVRNNSFGLHDRSMYGNGGVWVKRD